MTEAGTHGGSGTPGSPFRRRLLLSLLTAVAYYLTARLGYSLMLQPAGVAIWPAAGLLLGILLVRPRREWPALAAAALAGNIAADLGQGATIGVALSGGLANLTESLAAAWVVLAIAGRQVTLRSLREVLALIVGGAVVSNAVTSLIGSLVLQRGAGMDFVWGWFVWWAGDGLGMLLVAPAIVVWAGPDDEPSDRRMRVEATVTLTVLAAAAFAVVAPEPAQPELVEVTRHLIFPILFLIAVRHGMHGATLAVLLVGAIVAWEGAHTLGIFTRLGEPASRQLAEVYSYLALVAISALIPAAILQERESARHSLRESDARFREMAEHIQDAFFVMDVPGGRTRYVSPSWSTIWGRPIEVSYDPAAWLKTIHPDDRDAVAETFARVAAGNADESTFRVVRPDGEVRWVQPRTFPVQAKDGTVQRVVGVSRDVTGQRQAEERQGRSERLESLGRLAGGVAHDFNNVLGVILADAEMLDDALEDPAHLEMVAEIRGAGDRAADLTRQLLAFARRQVVTPTVFDASGMLRSMRGLLERLSRADITVQIEGCEQPCLVRADQGQLEHVLINLVANARAAMPDGGVLTVAAHSIELELRVPTVRGEIPPGRYVLLTVRDTGTGISEEVRARMFEPFFTTKPAGQGTGLGLATSDGIVAKAQGYLTVESEPGHGATFGVYLPQVDGDVTAPSTARDVVGGAERVLLVEDDVMVRRVAVRLLEGLGYTVTPVGDAGAALSLLDAQVPFDLLFTDVVLPGMGGRELAEAAAGRRPGLPVLFASGYTEDVLLQQQLLIGSMPLLRKPYSREQLARKVRAVLEAANGRG